MGLLDDAIREHLELKRQRGADPDEVAREQREALEPAAGPAVLDEEISAEDATSARVSGAPLSDPGGRTPVQAPARGGELPPEAASPEVGVSADPAAAHSSDATEMGETAELDMSSVLGENPEHEVPGGGAASPAAETDAPDAESLDWEMPGEGEDLVTAQADEDVLEETPDFLRDTPEQERLWFEQRPPRDFDFDK